MGDGDSGIGEACGLCGGFDFRAVGLTRFLVIGRLLMMTVTPSALASST